MTQYVVLRDQYLEAERKLFREACMMADLLKMVIKECQLSEELRGMIMMRLESFTELADGDNHTGFSLT